jgi:hypothetical protein
MTNPDMNSQSLARVLQPGTLMFYRDRSYYELIVAVQITGMYVYFVSIDCEGIIRESNAPFFSHIDPNRWIIFKPSMVV